MDMYTDLSSQASFARERFIFRWSVLVLNTCHKMTGFIFCRFSEKTKTINKYPPPQKKTKQKKQTKKQKQKNNNNNTVQHFSKYKFLFCNETL